MKEKLKSAVMALLLMCMTVPSSIAQTQATPRGLTEMVNNFTAVRTSFTIGPEASPDYLRGLEKRLDPKIVHTSNIVDSFKWTRYRNARTRKIIKYEYRVNYLAHPRRSTDERGLSSFFPRRVLRRAAMRGHFGAPLPPTPAPGLTFCHASVLAVVRTSEVHRRTCAADLLPEGRGREPSVGKRLCHAVRPRLMLELH